MTEYEKTIAGKHRMPPFWRKDYKGKYIRLSPTRKLMPPGIPLWKAQLDDGTKFHISETEVLGIITYNQNFDKRLLEIRKTEMKLSELKNELHTIQNNCNHQFPDPPFYHATKETPEGMTHFIKSETCLFCGKDCHDPEEWK